MSESVPNSRGLPDALSTRAQWLCWRAKERDGRMTKVPVDPTTGGSLRPPIPTLGAIPKPLVTGPPRRVRMPMTGVRLNRRRATSLRFR